MKVLFPSTFLAPYVEAYYISSDLRQDSPGAHFPAISTSYIKFSSGSAVVSGQATKPTVAVVDLGNETGLGVKLRPGAFPALFGLPAHELTDRVAPLEEILGKTANELNEQIVGAPNPSAQVGCFESTFARFVEKHYESSHLIERQAATILRQLSTMQVSNLAERLGYSSRHFQRKINDYVGLSPRLYKRIVRFERTLELIQRSAQREQIDWSGIAVVCGYTDQAHFIHEFRQFAGQTPVAYLVSFQGN